MRITTTLTLFGITVLAIAVSGLGCNNQTPPPRQPQPLPTQNTFGDIDSALCRADSIANALERKVGIYETGVSVDVKPIPKKGMRLMSPVETDEPAYIIEQ